VSIVLLMPTSRLNRDVA